MQSKQEKPEALQVRLPSELQFLQPVTSTRPWSPCEVAAQGLVDTLVEQNAPTLWVAVDGLTNPLHADNTFDTAQSTSTVSTS
eukprot:6214343-Amphidinium_carterae.1